jgi:chorismate synthase
MPATMACLSCSTAGESHGPALTALVQGLPAGVTLDADFIDAELRRRQGGYGRGGRQKIECDRAAFLAGARGGRSTGAPLVIQIANRDSRLDDAERTPPLHRPRPGHADLAGAIKWLTADCRDTLERASARETAARTAAGAVARCMLREFGIEAFGFVRGMLDVVTPMAVTRPDLDAVRAARDASEVYCPDPVVTGRLVEHIRQAKVDRDTVGGLIEVIVFGCPIAGAVMSIQAIKSVEIGLGRECAQRRGSKVHDPIMWRVGQRGEPNLGFDRPSNNAGGLEGGMTNGMPVVVRAAMKPISTLLQGMPSVDLVTLRPERSAYERSDVCALPAASVVMENVVAFEVARAFLEKFAGDTMDEVRDAYASFLERGRRLARGAGSAGGSPAARGEAEQSEA